MQQRQKCLCTVCCGDSKLNHLVEILEGSDKKAHYRLRRYAGPSRWNDATRAHELYGWYEESISFRGEHPPVTGGLVLTHTNCAAIATNSCFQEAAERKSRFPSTTEGELEFCLDELAQIREKTRQLALPAFPFGWFFAAVDTVMAEHLPRSGTLHNASRCLHWLDGEMPDFFRRRLEAEKISLGITDPVVGHNGHRPSEPHHEGHHSHGHAPGHVHPIHPLN